MFGKHASLGLSVSSDTMKKGAFSRASWLGYLDSNQGCRDQNPVPYRLAIPQYHRYDSERSGCRQPSPRN